MKNIHHYTVSFLMVIILLPNSALYSADRRRELKRQGKIAALLLGYQNSEARTA